MGPPRGLNPALSARQPTLVACSQRIAYMLCLITYNALNYHRRLCQTTFIHSGHFYGAPSNPLLLRGAPDYSTDTVSEFHAEAQRQLKVKDLPKVPTWRLERESNPRPSG